jgi:hypothetical protein
MAALQGHLEVLKLFLNDTRNIPSKFYNQVIREAVLTNNEKTLQIFLFHSKCNLNTDQLIAARKVTSVVFKDILKNFEIKQKSMNAWKCFGVFTQSDLLNKDIKKIIVNAGLNLFLTKPALPPRKAKEKPDRPGAMELALWRKNNKNIVLIMT